MAHLNPLTRLSDQQLLRGLSSLVADKRRSDAALLAHIAEVDRRKLYAPEGYDSMFAYCTRVLRLSEGGAYNRIAVARAARKYPLVFDKLEAGEIHHTGLRLLAPHLTQDNHRDLLDAATHKTRREIEHLLAERFPQPDVPTTVRALPQRPSSTPLLSAASPSPSPLAASPSPPTVAPLSPRRYRVELTVPEATKDKLDRAKALLRHRSPHVDETEVLDRALDALIEQLEKRKFGKTDKPRACKDSESRYIPADVRRAVSERDEGRCTFESEGGTPCESTAFLEYDHVVPHAVGGKATVENLRLRCRAHNQYTARQAFGDRAREPVAGYGSARKPDDSRAASPIGLWTTAARLPTVTMPEPLAGRSVLNNFSSATANTPGGLVLRRAVMRPSAAARLAVKN